MKFSRQFVALLIVCIMAFFVSCNSEIEISSSDSTKTKITGLTISPKTDLTLKVNENKKFTVSYTPKNAKGNVTWSVSNPNVLAINGSTVTAKAVGSSEVVVTLNGSTTIKDSVIVTVISSTDPVPTTTLPPVGDKGLGETHPTSGQYSPVDSSKWATESYALGAHVVSGNTTFALYSKNATKVLLEIYDQPYGADAKYDYWMTKNTSTNVWQIKLSGDLTGTYYAFRVWGPNWTFSDNWKRGNSESGFNSDCDASGNRFNPNKVVFDPYAKEISHDKSNPTALGAENGGIYGTGSETYASANGNVVRRNFDTGKYAPKAIVINDSTDFGTKPQISAKDAIIYESHARGLTKHPSASSLSSILSGMDGFENVVSVPDEYRGTYKGAGYIAKYLKALGINTIELLPVHESDNDANPDNAPGGNYWAYMTYGYFAPDRRYSYDKTPGGPTKEFKEMVKAFHDQGIEVYLDVVFNHSGEGGPWYGDKDDFKCCELTFMRGIDNATYYCLCNSNKSYWESSGCGNNLQCDNPIVRQFILDSLTYWIDKMGVDGFRFDLAPVLGREYDAAAVGHEKEQPLWKFNWKAQTLLDIISLGKSKNAEMIAESWDCAGDGYSVGYFPEGWGGWNGKFRDGLRGYVGAGNRGDVCNYINGSFEEFATQRGTTCGAETSINFIVAHDGFTLADLCSYGGVGNSRNSILSWPFGSSDGGNGDNNAVDFGSTAADKRQANRNYTAIQMISRGVPMIVWGDEFNRTQNGNNNPYNIDSVVTWNNYNMINTASPHLVATGDGGAYDNCFGTYGTDYSENKLEGSNVTVNGNFKFMQYMLNLRKNEPALRQDTYNVTYEFKKENGTSELGDGDRCVWLKINGSSVTGGSNYLVFMNMYTNEVSFTIPSVSGKHWTRLVDTQNYFETNYNCWSVEDDHEVSGSYGVHAWSVVILKELEGGSTNPPSGNVTLTFTNNKSWDSVYAYFFKGSDTVGAAWPGTTMTSAGQNEYGEGLFTITVPSGATSVIFNNGSGAQSVNIELTGSDTKYYLEGDYSPYSYATW